MFRTIVFVALFVSGDCEKYFREPRYKHEGHHDFATSPRHRGPESERRVVSNRSSSQNCVQINWDNKTERVVGIKTIRPSTHTRTFYHDNDCSYNVEVNVPIEFTCRLRDVAYIRWTGHGIKTKWVANDTLRLILTPDDDDRNLNLTCEGAPTPNEREISKKITITLDMSTPSSITKTRQNIYLEKGKSWSSNSSCQVLIRKLGHDCNLDYNISIVINNFDEAQNGTEFSCIYCQKYQSRYSQKFQQRITIFERIKNRTIYYLDDETQKYTTSKTTRYAAENVLIVTSKILEVNKGNKYDEARRSPATIVGYVFGAVAMVSVGVILGIWFKSLLLRRAARNDDANQVIYTEIEEKPTAPPPPPRNNTPYAQIIGTLVPKQQVIENPYATIDNPYVTVR